MAEQLLERPYSEQQIAHLDFETPNIPDVLVVPEMLCDVEARQKAACFIGAAALGTSVEAVPIKPPVESLYDAIHLAAAGDETALNMVRTNARTDVIERTIKTGHVMDPVRLGVTADGSFIQHGQTTESVQANSLRFAADHPVMRARVEAETRNMFRTKELYDRGYFKDYNMVVISRAEKLPGFFLDTMSLCIQVTSEQDEGLAIESAFVSGIAAPGEEQHDEQTVIKLGKALDEDVDFTGMSPTQIIDTPILVPKEKMPNGAIDIVKLLDDCAGGTFFGERKPREDYLEYRKKCHEREVGFQPRVVKITSELLAEAPAITNPTAAIDRLQKISGKHMVEHAMTDMSIDSRVFGIVAAHYIEEGRLAAERGDWEALDYSVTRAKDTEQSTSCPSGRIADTSETTSTSDKDKLPDDKHGSRYFNCPKCGKENVRKEKNVLLKHCQKCGGDVSCK